MTVGPFSPNAVLSISDTAKTTTHLIAYLKFPKTNTPLSTPHPIQ